MFFESDATWSDPDGTESVPGVWDDTGNRNEIPGHLSPFDFIFFNEDRAPGICRVEGGRHCNFDLKAAIAQLVPSATFLGWDPVPLTIVLILWTPDQMVALQEFLPQLLPPSGPNPKLRAVNVFHPSLALYGIHTIFIQSASFPRHVGRQVFEIELQAYEFPPSLNNMDPHDPESPLPQGNKPGATQPTNTVIPPSENPRLLGPG